MEVSIGGTALAWWGAVLSTLLAILRVIEHLRDRARLRVTVARGFTVPDPVDCIVVTGANVGQRPVVIERILVFTCDGKWRQLLLQGVIHASSNLPHKLLEGEAYSVTIPQQVLSDLLTEERLHIRGLGFADVCGRRYCGKFTL